MPKVKVTKKRSTENGEVKVNVRECVCDTTEVHKVELQDIAFLMADLTWFERRKVMKMAKTISKFNDLVEEY